MDLKDKYLQSREYKARFITVVSLVSELLVSNVILSEYLTYLSLHAI